MEDEERQKKLEAGKAKLAEYRQRKAYADSQKKQKKKKKKEAGGGLRGVLSGANRGRGGSDGRGRGHLCPGTRWRRKERPSHH